MKDQIQYIRVSEEAIGSRLNGFVYFRYSGTFFHLGYKVHYGDVRCGHTDRQAVKFARELRNDLAYCCCRACLCRDHIDGSGPGPSEVAVGKIKQSLIVCIGVYSGNQPGDDAKSVQYYFGHRGETVGGTGGVGRVQW